MNHDQPSNARDAIEALGLHSSPAMSRRNLLRAGLGISAGGILLAACGSDSKGSANTAGTAGTTGGSTATTGAGASEDFAGKTLQVWSTVTPEAMVNDAKAAWEARTGGKVEVAKLDFGDVPIKYAGVIASSDPSVDVLYTYAGFMGQFGDRIYDDLTPFVPDTSPWLKACIDVMTAQGKLRALPVHSETEVFIYNKQHFADAGLDPDDIPQTWDELYESAAALTSGNRYPCVVPWIAPQGRKSILYWLVYYNSFPDAKFVSDDYTEVLFDNEAGLETWKAIDRGFKAKFFDPSGVSLANDYESGLVFNQGQSASQINYTELWGQAVSGNVADFQATIDPADVGVSVMPGVTAGTHGGANGFEGFGINKFSKQKEMAASFILELAGHDVQMKLAKAKTFPSSRVDVLEDPAVQADYPLAATAVEQGKYNAYFVNTPYVVQPVFADATTKLYNGDYTPEQAHDAAVKGVKDLIDEYKNS